MKLIAIAFLLLPFLSYAQSDTTVVELINFELPSVYFQQGTPTTNLWQIGRPSKSTFTEAFSESNAIVTDTVNSYPVNNHSWFDLVFDLRNRYNYPNLGIGFYQKMQTSIGHDGGYITVSYDKGNSWVNIIDDSLSMFFFSPGRPYFPNINLYAGNDTLFNSEKGFSGTIPQWQYVEFYWVMDMVTKSFSNIDTLIVRFNFVSDDVSEQLDGWMIDNISLIFNHDVGSVRGTKFNQNLIVYPNPMNEETVIQTRNQELIQYIEVYSSEGKIVEHEKVQNDEFVFKKGNLKDGIYLINCLFKNSGSETIRVIIK